MIAFSVILYLILFLLELSQLKSSMSTSIKFRFASKLLKPILSVRYQMGRPRMAARTSRRWLIVFSLFFCQTCEEYHWYVCHLLRYFIFLHVNIQWKPFEPPISSCGVGFAVCLTCPLFIPFVCVILSLPLLHSGNPNMADICWCAVMGCNAPQNPCY